MPPQDETLVAGMIMCYHLMIMKYSRYTINTTTEAEDIIIAGLADAGIEGVEIEDSEPLIEEDMQGMFIDPDIKSDVPEGTAKLTFYFDDTYTQADIAEKIASVKEILADAGQYVDTGAATIDESVTEDRDWINNWKNYFHSFEIVFDDGSKAEMIPSWEKQSCDTAGDLVIHIDPGTAFGTGAHETTYMCIQELKNAVRPGQRILDIGTGSGILSMMALKFGAVRAAGTDLDPNSIPAAKDNFKKNGLENADFDLIIGDVLSDPDIRERVGSGYDICAANILPVVLIPLIPLIEQFIVPGGTVILSGILNEKLPDIKEQLDKCGYETVSERSRGEWAAVRAVLKKENI